MNVLYDLLLPAPDFSRALAFLLSNSPSVNKDNILYHQADDLTPMHYACSEGAGAELIQLMLNNTKPKPKDPTNINICSLLDDTGNTPLHYLCESKSASLCSAKLLIDTYPEACVLKNSNDEIPLDVAVRSTLPPVLIDFLTLLTIDEIKGCSLSDESIVAKIEEVKESKPKATLSGDTTDETIPVVGRSRRTQSRNIFSLAASRRGTSSRTMTSERTQQLAVANQALLEKEATVNDLEELIAEKEEQIQELGEAGLEINELLELAETNIRHLQGKVATLESDAETKKKEAASMTMKLVAKEKEIEQLGEAGMALANSLEREEEHSKQQEELVKKTMAEAAQGIKKGRDGGDERLKMKINDLVRLKERLGHVEEKLDGEKVRRRRAEEEVQLLRLRQKKEVEGRKEKEVQEGKRVRLLKEEELKGQGCCCTIC